MNLNRFSDRNIYAVQMYTVNLKMPSLTLTFQISFSAPQNTQIFSRNLPNVGVIKLEKGTKKNINSKCLKKCMIQEHKRCPPPLSLPAPPASRHTNRQHREGNPGCQQGEHSCSTPSGCSYVREHEAGG